MSYTITNNIMYIRNEVGELVPVSMIASGAIKSVNNIKPDENGNVTIEIPENFSGDYNDLINIPSQEEFVFTLEDGTTVTKKVLVVQ